jgi:hypothetical protein
VIKVATAPWLRKLKHHLLEFCGTILNMKNELETIEYELYLNYTI